MISSSAVWDFSNLQHHLNGRKGGAGTSKRRVGSRGLDKVVHVPVGTVIHLTKGSIPSISGPCSVPDDATWEDWDESLVQGVYSAQGKPLGSTIHVSSTNRLSSVIQVSEDISVNEGMQSDFVRQNLSSQLNTDQICPGKNDEVEGRSDVEDNLDFFGNEGETQTVSDSHLDLQSTIAEFVSVGQSLIVACGGQGGRGNAAIARGRGSQKQLPSLEHEPGLPGSEAGLVLELKTIADVGLVGAPNAGKSTLLGALSRAKPAIGHYKFTTLRPNIGKLEFDDYFLMTVADIPGLINGAHENRGLGHAFLRHIERTKALAYVLDMSAGQGENKEPSPWEQFEELIFELEQYKEGLSKRPSIIVANKIDELGAEEALQELRKRVPFLVIYPVCAVLEEGIDELKLGLRMLVQSGSLALLPVNQFSM